MYSNILQYNCSVYYFCIRYIFELFFLRRDRERERKRQKYHFINLIQGDPAGVVETETHVYKGEPENNVTTTTTVPLVATETRKVAVESEDGMYSATGEIVSSQTISSKTRTVETITVRSEIF